MRTPDCAWEVGSIFLLYHISTGVKILISKTLNCLTTIYWNICVVDKNQILVHNKKQLKHGRSTALKWRVLVDKTALYPFFPVRKTSGNRKCHRILNFCYFMPSNLGCYKREEITIFLNYGGKNEGGGCLYKVLCLKFLRLKLWGTGSGHQKYFISCFKNTILHV